MRLTLMTVALLGFGAAGCGEYYYGGAEYPETYDPPPVGQQPAGSVGAITNTSAPVSDNNSFGAGNSGQDVMVGQTDDYADTDPSALTDFKTTLDPYGSWYDDSTYGTVWQPSPSVVGADFAPYVTAGHWAYDDDYVWVSDYDWGWAPFHYGRWVYVAGRGWCWVPGRRYAGAWVSWRYGGPDYGYVGWGPLPPSWYWYDGYAYGLGFAVYTPYTFCGRGDLFSPVVGTRVIGGAQVATIANGTHVYVPANDGGRTPASPHVGSGGIGSKIPMGPPPGLLGFAPGSIPHVPLDHPGLVHAQQFAHASTATPLGAHGPQQINRPTQTPYPPQGTIGANRPVATAPQYNTPSGPRYAPPAYRAPSYYNHQPSYSGPGYRPSTPTPGYRPPAYSSPSYSAPYRGSPSYTAPYRGSPSSPAYRASPSAPMYRGGGSSFGGGGGYHAPSYSTSSPSHSYSSHSGGGGGHHR